jgi:hypothetical protein
VLNPKNIFEELTLKAILDENFIQDYGSFGIEYPAQKWRPEYDEARTNGGIYSQELKKNMELNFSRYISAHMQQFTKKENEE